MNQNQYKNSDQAGVATTVGSATGGVAADRHDHRGAGDRVGDHLAAQAEDLRHELLGDDLGRRAGGDDAALPRIAIEVVA